MSPHELNVFVETVIRKLKNAGLNARPLERVRETAFTTGDEWRGELGLAVWKIAGQDIRNKEIREDLDRIAAETRRAWPGFPSVSKNGVHPQLLSDFRLNRYVGVPIMGLIALAIFHSLVAAAAGGNEDWPLLLLRGGIGAIFVCAAAYSWTRMRWRQRVSRLIQQTEPIPVQVRFHRARRALVATVTPTAGQFQGRTAPYSPPLWKARMDVLEGTEMLGYVDPDPRGPIVLETQCGLIIWPLRRGRVETLKS